MALDTDNSLIALAEAKTWIGITVNDFDSVIENFIDGVSWQFNKYTGRELKARDRTDYYDGDGTDRLMVNDYPINSVTKLYTDSDRDYTADTEITDYITYGDEGLIIAEDDNFAKAPQSVKIEYNGGYSTIPYDLQVACKDQVKYMFRQWQDNQEGLSSVGFGDGTETRREIDEFLPSVKAVLDNYKRHDHGTAHA